MARNRWPKVATISEVHCILIVLQEMTPLPEQTIKIEDTSDFLSKISLNVSVLLKRHQTIYTQFITLYCYSGIRIIWNVIEIAAHTKGKCFVKGRSLLAMILCMTTQSAASLDYYIIDDIHCVRRIVPDLFWMICIYIC